MWNKRATALVGLMLCAVGGTASSNDTDMIGIGTERYTFAIGQFLPAFDTKVRVAGEDVGTGDDVDVEDELNIDRTERSLYAAASWRFKPNHRMFVSYFRSERENSAVAEDEIQIGDEIYPVGASLDTKLTFDVVPINYAYSFKRTSNYELAVTAGLHWTSLTLDVQGSASAGNQDVDRSVTARVNAPMPLIGLLFDYAITPRWFTGVRGEVFWFDIATDTVGVGGTIGNLRLSTDYWITRNIGLGAAVNVFQIDIDVDRGDWDGNLQYGYVGPQIYASLRF